MVTPELLAEARLRARAHVLVADDNPVNQKVAARMLEKLGYQVDVAANGREAADGNGAGPPAAGPASVLDPAIMADLKDLDQGRNVVAGLAAIFVGDAKASIATMKDAIASGDHAALQASAHRLRGSSGSLGATAMAAAICTELETSSPEDGDGPEAAAGAIGSRVRKVDQGAEPAVPGTFLSCSHQRCLLFSAHEDVDLPVGAAAGGARRVPGRPPARVPALAGAAGGCA